MNENFSIAFKIWLRGQIIYFLLNLLAAQLLIISVGLAIVAGIPALMAFGFCYHMIVSRFALRFPILPILLLAVTITFMATLFAAFLFEPDHFWREWKEMIIFPMAGIASAAISTLSFSKRIKSNVQS